MAKLTISLDDNLLRRARERGAERGTSVNAVLRGYLVTWTGRGLVRTRAVAALVEQSERATSTRRTRHWTRDDLHER